MSESACRLPTSSDLEPPAWHSSKSPATACRAQPHYRVVEVHPLLRCCAAAAGRRIESLPRSLLERLIVDAAAESYDAVSVSGGEPLLATGLFDTLALAREFGLATALTTDLAPLTARRLDKLAGSLDAIAICLDGVPASHDRIRGKSGAFAAMAGRLPALRAAGIPFGFIFTLTLANLDELPWVARFALEQGARLLQIRPMEDKDCCAAAPGGRPRPGGIGADACYFGFMRRCGQAADRLSVRLDLGHRDQWGAESGGGLPLIAMAEAMAADPAVKLADLVGSLIVEADGAAVPLRHGYPRHYALGNLRSARLPVLAARWRRDGGYARFCAHRQQLLREAAAVSGAPPAFNWFEAVASRLAPPVALAID